MKHEKLIKLCLGAVFAALSCIATMLIQIPMPATGGYINLGDCMVLLGELIMVLGYFGFESLVMGYGMAAAASIPGNAIQGLVGIVLAFAVYRALTAVPYVKKLCC